MSTYQEHLENMTKQDMSCGLGKVLREEGQEKHDKILDAIFAVDPNTGRMFSTAKVEQLFKEEYGWSQFFYRRHRYGSCRSCLNRTQTN